MIPFLLITILAASSPTEALFSGVAPQEIPTFEVTIGSEPAFFAALRVNGQWLKDHRTEIKPTQVVEFVPDIPYYAGKINRVLMRNAVIAYEPPAMRRKRLEELWTSMGYTFIETPSGWQTVKKDDITLAQRARDLAAQPLPNQRPAADAEKFATDHDADGTANTKWNNHTLWAVRAGIILTAITLLAVLYLWWQRHPAEWTHLE